MNSLKEDRIVANTQISDSFCGHPVIVMALIVDQKECLSALLNMINQFFVSYMSRVDTELLLQLKKRKIGEILFKKVQWQYVSNSRSLFLAE